MTHREFRMLLVLLLGIAGSTLAQAQTPVALIHDLGVGDINFAAGDLKAALVQNGYSVTDLPLGDLSRATQAVRIILTTSDANVPGMPAISGLTNQGYAIQQVVDGSATNCGSLAKMLPERCIGAGTLQTTTNLPESWNDVSGVTSPFLADTTNPTQFFHVKQ